MSGWIAMSTRIRKSHVLFRKVAGPDKWTDETKTRLGHKNLLAREGSGDMKTS